MKKTILLASLSLLFLTAPDAVNAQFFRFARIQPTCARCESAPQSSPASPASPTSSPCDPATTLEEYEPEPIPEEAEVALERINAARISANCRPLVYDEELQAGAERHCRRMSLFGGLFHASGRYWEVCAQNGGSGIDEAVRQWSNSRGFWRLFGGRSYGHAEIMLNPNATRCGVATYRDRFGRNWCVARFR